MSYVSYSFSKSGGSIELAFPSPYNVNPYTIEETVDVVCSYDNCILILPADGLNQSFFLSNSRSSIATFSLMDSGGSALSTIIPGVIYLVQGTTVSWVIYPLGEASSQLTAAYLQGRGLNANDALLSTVTSKVTNINDGSVYTVGDGDQSSLIVISTQNIFTLSLSQSYIVGFTFSVQNSGTGIINIVPGIADSTIALINFKSSFSLYPGQYATLVFDGNNWFFASLTPSAIPVNGTISVDLANAQGSVTLDSRVLAAKSLYLYSSTNRLTSPMTVYFETEATNSWLVINPFSSQYSISVVAGTAKTPIGQVITLAPSVATTVVGYTLSGRYSLMAPSINSTTSYSVPPVTSVVSAVPVLTASSSTSSDGSQTITISTSIVVKNGIAQFVIPDIYIQPVYSYTMAGNDYGGFSFETPPAVSLTLSGESQVPGDGVYSLFVSNVTDSTFDYTVNSTQDLRNLTLSVNWVAICA